VIFWDTSALVKCYSALEAGHERAKNLLLGERGHKGSILLWPEATSAVVRRTAPDRRLGDSILRLLKDHLQRFDLMPIDDAQVELAVKLIRRKALRGADAIHLAAALSLARELGKGALRFASSDGDQAAAAKAEGLKVIEP
jgi:predicted nucleic acid-binding protein